ncbi:response regulator [Desulfuromonas thiophila]|uniref:Response regulator receiver domain-containing protein n=1 Tax=Desulfuromonas thiophila TaxID=57664 RepID=A0A1G7DLJ2_9BACT|nr:response regulator [Desulfuromonas thiophila]SDE52401.1 Response regulator receiver domain-containing protein [Desulfuromonas thiophila]
MNKRLLLADDSVTIQKVVEITLTGKPYDLVAVGNGDEALRLARQQRPDLILADVFMPGKNGYELCELVRQDPALAAVPVLLLAGSFEPFDEKRASAAGADGWIAKPFSSQDLIDRVAELLARAPAADWQASPSRTPDEGVRQAFSQAAAEMATPVAPAPPASAPVVEPSFEQPFEQLFEPAQPAATEAAADEELFGGGAPQDFSFESLDESTPVPAPAGDFAFDPTAFDLPVDSAADLAPAAEAAAPSPAAPAAETPVVKVAAAAPVVAVTAPVEPPALADELPSLDAFAADLPQPPAAVAEEGVMALKEEQIVAEGAYGAVPERVEKRVAFLSDEQLMEIVERVAGAVIERLAAPQVEKVVWEVVPDLAERMIRDEMDRLRRQSGDA